MSKDQQPIFEAHCSEWLDMNYHLPIAQKAYLDAYKSETVVHKKDNAGTRAMNLYLLNELKKVHAENWRLDKDGNKPKPKQIPRQALTQEQRQQYTAKPKTGFLDNEISRIYNEQKGKMR